MTETLQISKSVCIVGMSAKPPHRGHEALIKAACDENDIVFLVVSVSTRERPGEVIISKDHSEEIWVHHMKHVLSSKVVLIFTGGLAVGDRREEVLYTAKHALESFIFNATRAFIPIEPIPSVDRIERATKLVQGPSTDTPVGWTWWLMGALSVTKPERHFNIYVGPDDADRFPQDKIDLYVGVGANVSINVMGGERLFGISGTLMREWLAEGYHEKFIENLPTALDERSKEGIWTLLRAHGVHRAPEKKSKNSGKKK
jgi:hypothetical protein